VSLPEKHKIYIEKSITKAMATTIQLPIELKNELDKLKEPKMSYADLIKSLIKKERKRQEHLLLREYCEKYNKESLEEVKEWSSTESWEE
jgi:predicted CopG family antitoxin